MFDAPCLLICFPSGKRVLLVLGQPGQAGRGDRADGWRQLTAVQN